MTEALSGAPQQDVNRFKACMPIFYNRDAKVRLLLSSSLSYINLDRPNLIRRLNRVVRISGNLGLKDTVKKIDEILDFARAEHISFLEETSIVTLCQLFQKKTIERFRGIMREPTKNVTALNGYSRGARFLPPKLLFHHLLYLLTHQSLFAHTRDILVSSLNYWNLAEIKNEIGTVFKVLISPNLSGEQKHKLGDVLSYYVDSTMLQTLIELTQVEDDNLKVIAIKALAALAKKDKNIFLDVLVNRLYALMDSDNMRVQVQALLTLVEVGDDYAMEVFRDQLDSQNQEYTVHLLREMEERLSHELLAPILNTVYIDSTEVQDALRDVIGRLSHGPFAEEVRNILVNTLKDMRQERTPRDRQQQTPVDEDFAGQMLGHAKIEFKFKRENSQMLTVFFIDMAGFTARTSASDTSTMMDLIKTFENIVVPDLEHFKGQLVKKLGDGMLAVFKHPLNAIAAALSIQEKIGMYNQYRVGKEKFSVRIGLNTGLVIRKDGDVYGETVNIASRMETTANPGETLLTHATYEEVEDFVQCTPLGNIQIKGYEEAIMAYTADSLKAGVDSLAAGGGSNGDSGVEQPDEMSLMELLITPDFTFPENLEIDPKIPHMLQSLFNDIARAIEEISRDYHEENAFKRYLQNKWTEFVQSLG